MQVFCPSLTVKSSPFDSQKCPRWIDKSTGHGVVGLDYLNPLQLCELISGKIRCQSVYVSESLSSPFGLIGTDVVGSMCFSVRLPLLLWMWVSMFMSSGQSGIHCEGQGARVSHMLKKLISNEQFRWPEQIHLISATQAFAGLFLDLAKPAESKISHAVWGTWFRGEARPLGGKCEILWSSSTHLWLYKNYPRVRSKKQVMMMLQVADQGAAGGLLPLLLPRGENVHCFPWSSLTWFGMYFICPLQKAEILIKYKTSLSWIVGTGARKLEFFLIDHMVSFAALWSYKSLVKV